MQINRYAGPSDRRTALSANSRTGRQGGHLMPAADAFAAEWHVLAQALNLSAALSESLLTELQAGYGHPARHYHNKKHIIAMLNGAAGLEFNDPDMARLAIVFHDVIYDP